MEFTVLGADHFLGSGHPGSIENDPPFLGLIESRDAGSSWQAIALHGDVDFHVLEAQGNTVYGSQVPGRGVRGARCSRR